MKTVRFELSKYTVVHEKSAVQHEPNARSATFNLSLDAVMHQPFRIPRFVVVGDDLDGAVWKIMDHSKQENHDVYKTIPLAYGEKGIHQSAR